MYPGTRVAHGKKAVSSQVTVASDDTSPVHAKYMFQGAFDYPDDAVAKFKKWGSLNDPTADVALYRIQSGFDGKPSNGSRPNILTMYMELLPPQASRLMTGLNYLEMLQTFSNSK